MTPVQLADRMRAISGIRSWRLPVVCAGIPLVVTFILAMVRRQVDLGTYLMGGAHAFKANLYQVLYPPTGLGFTYPPFAATLSAPLAHLPVRVDQVAVSWVNVGLLFGLLAVCLRAVAPTLERRVVVWWALVLVLPVGMLDPIRETVLLGQVNLLVVLLVVADMTLDLPLPRGILVGLAAAIKITPIILIPYLFLTRQSKAGWRAIGVFVAAAAVGEAASPHASWRYWSHELWNPAHTGNVAWIGNQGIVGVVARAVRHQLSATSTFTLVVVVGGIGLAVASVAYRQWSPLLGLLVVEATESLASPVSWSHHFVWVVLLIAWLALGADRPTHGAWWAVGVASVFWAAPIWWVHHGSALTFAGRGWLIPVSDCFFLVLTAVVVATAIAVIRRSVSSSVAADPDPDGPEASRAGPSARPGQMRLGRDRVVGDDPVDRVGNLASTSTERPAFEHSTTGSAKRRSVVAPRRDHRRSHHAAG
jgi:alpha-1,2-mannosyltransferase